MAELSEALEAPLEQALGLVPLESVQVEPAQVQVRLEAAQVHALRVQLWPEQPAILQVLLALELVAVSVWVVAGALEVEPEAQRVQAAQVGQLRAAEQVAALEVLQEVQPVVEARQQAQAAKEREFAEVPAEWAAVVEQLSISSRHAVGEAHLGLSARAA